MARPGEIRVVVLGGGGVGKSATTIQYCQGHFIQEYDPTIEDSYRKQVIVDQETSMMDILDTAGMEEFSALRDQYLRTGEAFYIVYSITSRSSFEEILSILDSVKRLKEGSVLPLIICGNKSDLESERQVSFGELQELALENHCLFMETSAKLGTNIQEAFAELVRSYRKNVTAVASVQSGRRRHRVGGCTLQ